MASARVSSSISGNVGAGSLSPECPSAVASRLGESCRGHGSSVTGSPRRNGTDLSFGPAGAPSALSRELRPGLRSYVPTSPVARYATYPAVSRRCTTTTINTIVVVVVTITVIIIIIIIIIIVIIIITTTTIITMIIIIIIISISIVIIIIIIIVIIIIIINIIILLFSFHHYYHCHCHCRYHYH